MQGKTIPIAPNYIIYSDGQIKNKRTNKFLVGQVGQKNGYRSVNIQTEKGKKRLYIHRIVAITFIPNPENKEQVNHINGIKTDNRVENLEWVSPKENIAHAIEKLGFVPPKFSEETRQKNKEKLSVRIAKYDLDKNFICIYPSIIEASKQEHISRHSIKDVLNGKKGNHKGFIWRYV